MAVYPDCEKCRQLKDELNESQKALMSCRPDVGSYKSISRWPKPWREQRDRLENANNLARAKYEVHLGGDHQDPSYQQELGRNALIILRGGRLTP